MSWQIAADYAQWMAQNDIPKLFVNAEPGAILIGARQGILPQLEEPDRGDGAGLAFHPGRLRSRHRQGGGRLDAGKRAVIAAESAPRRSDSRLSIKSPGDYRVGG